MKVQVRYANGIIRVEIIGANDERRLLEGFNKSCLKDANDFAEDWGRFLGFPVERLHQSTLRAAVRRASKPA